MDKICMKCGDIKNSEKDFYKDKRTPDGLRRYCKECFRQYNIKNPKQRTTGEKHAKGERQWQAKLTESDIITIRKELKKGVPREELAEKFDTSYQNIKSIHEYRTWKHIKED